MKKLKLELGSIKEMLSKEQMKMVVGGYGGYGGYGDSLCTVECTTNSDCKNPSFPTCYQKTHCGSVKQDWSYCGVSS
jgi:hypothetical protein